MEQRPVDEQTAVDVMALQADPPCYDEASYLAAGHPVGVPATSGDYGCGSENGVDAAAVSRFGLVMGAGGPDDWDDEDDDDDEEEDDDEYLPDDDDDLDDDDDDDDVDDDE